MTGKPLLPYLWYLGVGLPVDSVSVPVPTGVKGLSPRNWLQAILYSLRYYWDITVPVLLLILLDIKYQLLGF
jgi:hypothetical protein